MSIGKVIDLINEKIFICESNITYLRDNNMLDEKMKENIDAQYGIYINLKHEIETLIGESSSEVN